MLSSALSLTKIIMPNLHHLFSSFLVFAEITFAKFFFYLEVTELNIRMVTHTYIAEIKCASEPKVTYVLAHTQIFPFQMVWFAFIILKWY